MNRNTNNQQVSDDFLEWIDKVIKFSKEDIFVGGVCGDLQIKLMEQIRDKYMSLNNSIKGNVQGSKEINDEEMLMDKAIKFLSLELPSDIWDDVNNKYQSFKAVLKSKSNPINEPITDKEIDAEIERYIKQFWPRPEHGGAVRLGFKRAVRWMQERQSNTTEPIVDNELLSRIVKSVLCLRDDADVNEMDLSIIFNQIKQISKQYAASKLNNIIEDKWISVEDEMPPKANPVLLYNGHWTGVGFYKRNYEMAMEGEPDWSDETSEYISPNPTHWQPLPKAPKK